MSVFTYQQVLTVVNTADLVPFLVFMFSYCPYFSFYKMSYKNICRISRTIRRTMIFSLDFLEKIMMKYFNFSNLLEENRIGTYQN